MSGCIIRRLHEAYVIPYSSIKDLFEKEVRYIGATVSLFDVNNSFGVTGYNYLFYLLIIT